MVISALAIIIFLGLTAYDTQRIREELKRRGLEGREWALGAEAGFTGEMQGKRVIEVADFKDETIATYGLKYIAEDTGCKSGYLFAIKTIDDKFIGTLGLDYTKRKTRLDVESINHLQV